MEEEKLAIMTTYARAHSKMIKKRFEHKYDQIFLLAKIVNNIIDDDDGSVTNYARSLGLLMQIISIEKFLKTH